nr:hypothetical protein [Veillonella intestinalis]
MMDIIVALLPFFTAGLVAALISRFTGIALSFVMAPTLLYWGAKPLELVAFMLTFAVYNGFTSETQDFRLNIKNLVLFKGWRIAIPIVGSLVLAFIAPPVSIAFFILCFIAELAMNMYQRLPQGERPVLSQVLVSTVIATIWCLVGVFAVAYIPEAYYFILVGLAMLGLTGFAWYAAKHRDAFRGTWTQIWNFLTLFLGLFGLDSSFYACALNRNFTSKQDVMIPVITFVAAFIGIMAIFATEFIFSMPALVAAVGAAIGMRFAGMYEFSRRGTFSYTAIAVTILAVVSLFLVSPTPVGLVDLEALFK